MRRMNHRSLVNPLPVVLIGVLLSVSALLVSGCGIFSTARKETKQLYKGVSSSKDAYKKTLVMLPLKNNAQWTAIDLDGSFAPELKDAIESECSGVVVLLPGSPGVPVRFNQSEDDQDSYALAVSGQASGVNLVLSGGLVGIRHMTEDRGIFWFQRVVHQARVQMDVTIFHTGTGAKLLDTSVFHNIEISEAEGELIAAGKLPGTVALPEALADIADAMGDMACNVLKFIPWEGYVKNVDGDRIVLSAGEACGLKKGKVLDVFGARKVTEGNSDQRYFVSGENVGTLTITAVYPDRSEAVVQDGGPVLPGSVVRAH